MGSFNYNNNVFVADFETITPETKYYQKNNDTKVILWGIQKLHNFTDYKSWGYSIDSFIEYLFSLKVSATIFFHNLSFDGDFVLKYLINILNYQILEESNFQNSIEIFKQGNNLYNFVVRINKNIKWYFRCSLKLLSAGVEKLGKSFNISKHENNSDTFYGYEDLNASWVETKEKNRIEIRPIKYHDNDQNDNLQMDL